MADNPPSAQHHASPQGGLQDGRAEASGDARQPAGAPGKMTTANAGELEFNEEWYLSRYPRIAQAIREGRFASGLQHYISHGQKEGRSPVPPPAAMQTTAGGSSGQIADLLEGADLAPRASQTQHLAVRLPEALRDRHATFVRRRAGMVADVILLTSSALLKAADGDFEAAEQDALEAFRVIASSRDIEPVYFRAVLTALFVVQRLDLVAHMLRTRYAPAPVLDIQIEEAGPGVSRVRWEIDASRRHRFVFDATLLQPAHDFRVLEQINRLSPLFFNYAMSPDAETDSVILNQGDLGIVPGLCYSDSRPGFFLIPDHIFVSSRGYQSARDHFASNPVPWAERLPVAFWRGSTTGVCAQKNAWRTLERVKLCELARANQKSGLFDVGFSRIARFTDPDTISEIEASGLVLGRVPWETWSSYKYLIDIDGNSSPWSNLFQRLLTGSPVLKVESYRGLRQWYYDDLVAWDNYVPIAPDASDLVDKVKWLIGHDSIAERIGQRGRELALGLTYESELARSVPVITSAFREARGETLQEFRPRNWSKQNTAEKPELPDEPNRDDVNAICQLLEQAGFDLEEYTTAYTDTTGLVGSLPAIVADLIRHDAAEGRRFFVRDPQYLKDQLETLDLTKRGRSAISRAIANAIPATRHYVESYLTQPGPHLLEVGAGKAGRSGWLTTDLTPKWASDGSFVIALDATKKFPLPTSAFDFAYSEHMIEHITYKDGVNMLRECHRVLKPGGTVRIATPSIGMLIRVMAPDRTLLEQRYFTQSLKASLPDAPAQTNAFFLNNFMRNWRHTFVYDRETLQIAMKQAGFSSIRECEFAQSRHAVLRNLEHHGRMPPGFLELETMVFEAVK